MASYVQEAKPFMPFEPVPQLRINLSRRADPDSDPLVVPVQQSRALGGYTIPAAHLRAFSIDTAAQ